MAISNPFSTSSSPSDSPSDSSFSSYGGASSGSSGEMKNTIIQQLQAEQAMSNARALITNITENCYEKCIPSPGSNLSSKDQTCLNACMEKYIGLWNTTSRTYIARAGREKPPGAEGMGQLSSGETTM